MSRVFPATAAAEACVAIPGLDGSRSHCTRVVRERAANFYYGMRLVPEPKRSATYALYAWMREADDIADGDIDADASGNADTGARPQTVAEKAQSLDRFWHDTQRVIGSAIPDVADVLSGPVWPAFADAVWNHGLSPAHLRSLIDGQFIDLRRDRYETFEQLYDYCYKVGGVVGILCLQVWGYAGGEDVRRLAEWRGVAFQLTNILRDVREDAERGRVYLPQELFYGDPPTPEELLAGPTPRLVSGLARLARKARHYYQASADLDRHVHRDGRPCLWAMTEIYRTLSDRIAADPAAVLRGTRVRLSPAAKAWIAMRGLCRT